MSGAQGMTICLQPYRRASQDFDGRDRSDVEIKRDLIARVICPASLRVDEEVSRPPDARHGMALSKRGECCREETCRCWTLRPSVDRLVEGAMSVTDGSLTKGQPDEWTAAVADAVSMAVSLEISPADSMYRGRKEHYLSVGRGGFELVQKATIRAELNHPISILDLPCGYGRVQRWLRAAYPNARITACDTQAAAVDFCVNQFRAAGVRATDDDAHWKAMTGPFDVIWCGSLLTHFNEDRWTPLLRNFGGVLSTGGIAVFTTHGRRSLDMLKAGSTRYGLPEGVLPDLIDSADRTGFGFKPKSGDYGVSVALPAWVQSRIRDETNLEIVWYGEAAWDNHQDVVMCMLRVALPL